MEILDSRRLTGTSFVWDRPAALLEIRPHEHDPDQIAQLWEEELERMLARVGWQKPATLYRKFPDFIALAFAAPEDGLYAATEINDWVAESIQQRLHGNHGLDIEPEGARLAQAVADEADPALLAMQQAAREHRVNFCADDEFATIGMGTGSVTWAIGDIPPVNQIDWTSVHDVPCGMVTGTNGKTTTVRLIRAMVQAAGKTPGLTSTDWIAVGEEIIDKGDYSGPGGARAILMRRDVEVAILEAARGGLIRRGLAIPRVDVSLITNIAEDHMGEAGVHDLDALLEVKWVITRALGKHGILILNADDPLLVARAKPESFITWMYSTRPDNPDLLEHMRNGGCAFFVEHGDLVHFNGRARTKLIAVNDVPLTLDGAAIHNVSNALGATGFALALGMPLAAILKGLRQTTSAANPGRGNLYAYNDARFLVDFAHNPHGLDAIFATADAMHAQRKLIVLGQAGDRSDEAIRGLVRKAWEINPDFVIVKEMGEYRRGREPGEVPAIIKDELKHLGCPEDRFTYIEKEIDCAKFAVDWSQPGDLSLLLVHGEKEAVINYFTGLTGA